MDYFEELKKILCENHKLYKQIGSDEKYRVVNSLGGYCFSGTKEQCKYYIDCGKAPEGFREIDFKDFGSKHKMELRHILWFAEENGFLYNLTFIDLILKINYSKSFENQDIKIYKDFVLFFNIELCQKKTKK